MRFGEREADKSLQKPKIANWQLFLFTLLLAVVSRLVPHLPNATPVMAIALFSGLKSKDWKSAVLLPWAALLLSDCILGFYPLMAWVYSAFALTVFLGWLMRNKAQNFAPIAGLALVGSSLFFLLTNFAVWYSGGEYPATLQGLLSCYVAALPFLRNELVANLVYTAVFFSVWQWVQAPAGFSAAMLRAGANLWKESDKDAR